ncbi:MAG: metal-dependent transcriptional regulator [bacterium]|nr:MAG: metal-dependent transcriptional regulator [bacterium]
MQVNGHSYEIRDEVLEELWVRLEEGGLESVPAGEIILEGTRVNEGVFESLREDGLISLDGSDIRLTDKGFEEARKTIRRHRLSERMFADIFDVVQEEMEDAACRFEHMLIKHELEEKICVLLGHPKQCPHGRSIPIGECCLRAETMVDQAVVPMNRLRQGESGVIAYVHSGDSEKLKKLMAMGILPGEPVALERRYPSFVFNVGFSRYAIDEGMAEAIFIRRQHPDKR